MFTITTTVSSEIVRAASFSSDGKHAYFFDVFDFFFGFSIRTTEKDKNVCFKFKTNKTLKPGKNL